MLNLHVLPQLGSSLGWPRFAIGSYQEFDRESYRSQDTIPVEFASELIFGQDRGMMTSELKSRELYAARQAVGYYSLFIGNRHLGYMV